MAVGTTHHSELDRVASVLVDHAARIDSVNNFVIALWPQGDARRVISGGGNNPLRAAVSVAVAADNTHPWADVNGESPVTFPIESLPEVVRTAAMPSNMRAMHAAVIRDTDGEPACVAMWFTVTHVVTDGEAETRREAVALLTGALDRDQETARVVAAAVAAQAAVTPRSDEPAGRPAYPTDDPMVDPVTGAATRQRFDRELDVMNVDEATLVLFGLDQIAEIEDEHGVEVADEVRRVAADRLRGGCRRTDVIARLDDETFGVLLPDVDRRTAFEVSRRLRAALSEPLPTELGVAEVTISAGLAHQVGLVDPTELFETAQSAVQEARDAGGSRMLVGS